MRKDTILKLEPIVVGPVLLAISVLVTLILTEPSAMQAERKEQFYRHVGIDGISHIIANKRAVERMQVGDLIKLRSGDLVAVQVIRRTVFGAPKKIRGVDQLGAERTVNVEDEWNLHCISRIIHQNDPNFTRYQAAVRGMNDP